MSTYLISCGEASGDLYAAALTTELASIDPSARVMGLGGERFDAAGGERIVDYRGLSVTGLVEALSVVPRSLAAYRRLVGAARAARPDVFVAIDFPDFNFRLAAAMKRLGVPIVYYICPQVWAWRRSRLRTLKKLVDHAIVIFPFEEEIYRKEGIPVSFVGHPLLDLACPRASRSVFLKEAGLDPARPVVALLPGSRPNELRALVPVLRDAMPIIAAAVPGVQYLVARAPGLDDELFAPLQGQAPGAAQRRSRHSLSAPLAVVQGRTDDVLASADLVLTCSGTATVQTAIHGRPMVVMYKLSALTYRLGIRFVHVDTYGMVNLVAGSRIVPELIQDDLTADRLAAEAIAFLTDADRHRQTTDAVRAARERLGAPGATARAARLVADIAGRRPVADASRIGEER